MPAICAVSMPSAPSGGAAGGGGRAPWRPGEGQRSVDRPREPRRRPAPGDMHVHHSGGFMQPVVVQPGLFDPAFLELTENGGDLALEQDEVGHEHGVGVAHLLERDPRAEGECRFDGHACGDHVQVAAWQPDLVGSVRLQCSGFSERFVHQLRSDRRHACLLSLVQARTGGDDEHEPREHPHRFVLHAPPGGDADSLERCSGNSRLVHLWHSSDSLLRVLTRDGRLLFLTRCTRLFAYGALSVVLVFYLTSLGLSASQTGMLLTFTLVGDTVVSLYLTTRADRIGRRRMLIIGAILMAAAGLTFAYTRSLVFLVVAGTIGVISPSGNEVGPFLPIEQAALAHVVPNQTRTMVFAWYTLAGSFATAAGSLGGGALSHLLQKTTMAPVESYRIVVLLYAALGVVLAFLFTRLSPAAEVSVPGAAAFGIGRSRDVVLRLSGLFALDAFAGGFVVQSFAAYWFYLRFGVSPGMLGAIFFWANVLAGVSALLASRLAARFGLVRTMVFTHLPSNILLILVPLMPNLPLAILVLLVRFSISQMDVPTRQSYIMAVVGPEERSAAGGITGVARTLGAAVAPVFAGFLYGRPSLMSVPFFIAGTLKVIYDLFLYR